MSVPSGKNSSIKSNSDRAEFGEENENSSLLGSFNGSNSSRRNIAESEDGQDAANESKYFYLKNDIKLFLEQVS